MSIKYYSITDTSDSHLETLKSRLESAAAAYFTSFVLSEDKFTLSCYDGDNPLLVFSMAAGCKSFVVTANGMSEVSTSSVFTSSNVVRCTRIAAAACGIALKFSIANADKGCGIFITKTKNGKTAVFFHKESLGSSSSSTSGGFCLTSESGNANRISILNANFPGITDITVNAPIAVGGTSDYCPNLFQMVNSQFYGTEGVLDIDGVKYLSNGYYLLKDE